MKFGKCGDIVVAVALLSACQAEVPSLPIATTTTATTSAAAIPTDLVGQWLPAAKDELAKFGFRNIDEVSVDSRAVIVQGNWQVVSVDGAGSAAPTNARITVRVNKPSPTPAPPPPTTTHTTEEAPPPASVYYANCTDAKRAGAAPIHRGQPGYRPELDRDHDGVACE